MASVDREGARMVPRCRCLDLNCPVCHRECLRPAFVKLYRTDLDDEIGTFFVTAALQQRSNQASLRSSTRQKIVQHGLHPAPERAACGWLLPARLSSRIRLALLPNNDRLDLFGFYEIPGSLLLPMVRTIGKAGTFSNDDFISATHVRVDAEL